VTVSLLASLFCFLFSSFVDSSENRYHEIGKGESREGKSNGPKMANHVSLPKNLVFHIPEVLALT
jgi:hypothetical protein